MLRLAAIASLAAVAVPAAAQSAGHYNVTFAAAPAKSTIVTRNTIWRCTGATCVAPKAGSRDAIMCELVAREVGAVQAFSVAGTAFDDAALAKCNTRAKG